MANASALMQSLEATAWLSDTSMQLVCLSEQGWSDSGGKCVDGNSDCMTVESACVFGRSFGNICVDRNSISTWQLQVWRSKQKVIYCTSSLLMITVVQGKGRCVGVNKACAKYVSGNSVNDTCVGGNSNSALVATVLMITMVEW